MRGLHSKFKILKDSLKAHLAKNSAKWKVFLYSIPAMALFAPLAALASAAAPGGGGKVINTIKTVGGAAAGFGKDVAVAGFGGLLQSGIETTGSLAVWIFIANQLSKLFADLFSGIFLFLINFLIGVSQYNSFLGANVVTIGWAVTRDIANMFLVVALLVIAFATILNINSYQASSLLKQFFFSAILVNFSKMICGVLIDASQVVMMTFVSGFAETAGGNFVRLFKIDGWLQLALGTAKSQAPGSGSGAVDSAATFATYVASSDFFSGIATNIFTAIISFIGILAILSLDIILVVRIVTIWFLVVAAPIAFVAKVLPVTKGFSSQWWSAFTKQLIAGPLVAFIVWISLASIAVSDNAFDLTSEARQKDALFAEANNTPSSKGQIAATKISQWENLALFFVPIVIFIMGAKWAVGVAGGAAKSITGFANKKLSGYATGGLRAFQKQAIGKGDFSVMSQAKKGWKGEGGFTTAALGGLGGGALGMVGAKKLSDKIGMVAGDRARAAQRDGRKGVAVTASKFGFGDLGHKRHEVHNADADAARYREIGAKNLAKDNLIASRIADPAARKQAEEEAQSRYAIMQKKADEAIHHAEEAQKEIFKADGLTDDGALLAAMKDQVAHGHVSETQLAVAKKMIAESVDKKVTGKIAEERQKWAAEKKDFTDAGGDPNDFRKFDENAVRGDAENEFGGRKKNLTREKDPVLRAAEIAKNPGIEDLYDKYKASPPLGITKDTTKTPTKLREDAEKEAVRVATTDLTTAHVNIANTFTTNMRAAAAPADVGNARAQLASSAGAALSAAHTAGAKTGDLKAVVQRTINLVPAPERAAFSAELSRSSGANPAIAALISEVQGDIARIDINATKNSIEERFNRRREEKPHESKQLTMKDLGAKMDSASKLYMPPEAVSQLEAIIKATPAFAARLGPEVMGQTEIKRMLGHVLADKATTDQVLTGLRREGQDKNAINKIKVHISEAIKMTNPDPAMKVFADALIV